MNFVIDPAKCSHPAQVQEANGVMKCLVCGSEVKPKKPPKKNEDKKPDDEKGDEKQAE